MQEQQAEPANPETPDDVPQAEPEPGKRYENVGLGRRSVWVLGGAVGAYMILRGLYGIITGEDEEQP
ncbi:hypothetical protein [Tessaracoccus sp. MC1756]|uniref:hypothetical protein n=1 Tax=Tessaracoccus sp. MC1756 TaxID=2760311 RepID=UPI0016008867|nr:hypothetical protein [Tessaracoccus sp. MC1756]MBB1509627.1 hypothetical protein [Tessaracoccus sp. MC1756]